MQRTGDEPEAGQRVHVASGLPVHGGGGGAGAMAVNQRCQQATIGEPWHSGVVGLGREAGHGLVAVLKGFDEVAMLVFGTAAVTVRQVFGVVVLKGFHGCSPVVKHNATEYVASEAFSVLTQVRLPQKKPDQGKALSRPKVPCMSLNHALQKFTWRCNNDKQALNTRIEPAATGSTCAGVPTVIFLLVQHAPILSFRPAQAAHCCFIPCHGGLWWWQPGIAPHRWLDP